MEHNQNYFILSTFVQLLYLYFQSSFLLLMVIKITMVYFGKKKISVDPTPIEVEMRLYENDIQTTVIAEYSRKGQELDVGERNTTDNYRS